MSQLPSASALSVRAQEMRIPLYFYFKSQPSKHRTRLHTPMEFTHLVEPNPHSWEIFLPPEFEPLFGDSQSQLSLEQFYSTPSWSSDSLSSPHSSPCASPHPRRCSDVPSSSPSSSWAEEGPVLRAKVLKKKETPDARIVRSRRASAPILKTAREGKRRPRSSVMHECVHCHRHFNE